MVHGEFDVLDRGEDRFRFRVQEGVLNRLFKSALFQFVDVFQILFNHRQQFGVSVQVFLVLSLPNSRLFRSVQLSLGCLLFLRRLFLLKLLHFLSYKGRFSQAIKIIVDPNAVFLVAVDGG